MKVSCAPLAGSIAVLALFFAACTVSPTTSGSGSGDGGNGGVACGMAFTGDKWSAACESWSDTYCCDEQSACAANADCARLVACTNACATPRQDTCTATCQGQVASSAIDLLNAIGSCSKRTPSDGHDIPSSCEWP